MHLLYFESYLFIVCLNSIWEAIKIFLNLNLNLNRYLGNTDVHVQFEHEPVILSLNLTASKLKTGSDDPWQIVTMVFETQIKVYFSFESSRELAHRDIS